MKSSINNTTMTTKITEIQLTNMDFRKSLELATRPLA